MGFSKQNTGVGCHALLQGVFPTQGLNPSMSTALQVDSLPLNHLGSPSEQREEQRQSRPLYLEPTLSTHPLFHPEFISNKDEWPNIWGKKRDRFSFLEIQKMIILSMVNWALEVCLTGPKRCLQWTEAIEFYTPIWGVYSKPHSQNVLSVTFCVQIKMWRVNWCTTSEPYCLMILATMG